MSWKLMAVCSNCNEVVEEPSFGNLWFTRNAYPVCPHCGGCPNYKKVKINYDWKGKELERENYSC